MDECYSHIQTTDGGYALAGHTLSFAEVYSDFWLLVTDENGDSLWSNTYGRQCWDTCTKIIQTEDDGFLLFGYTTDRFGGPNDALIVKTNAEGDSLWSKIFDFEDSAYFYDAVQTRDGGYAMAGAYRIDNRFEYFLLLRLDENCDSLWYRTYGGGDVQVCQSLIETSQGGFVLGGRGERFRNSGNDYLAIFTDENGDSLWHFAEGTGYYDSIHEVNEISEENYLLTGVTLPRWPVTSCNILTFSIDSEGEVIWSRTDGVDEYQIDDIGLCSFTSDENEIYISGNFENNYGFIKLSPQGEMIYEMYWENDKRTFCYSIIQDTDGGLSLAGFAGDSHRINGQSINTQDFFLLKTNSNLSIDDPPISKNNIISACTSSKEVGQIF